MAELKTNTRKRDYHIAITMDGKIVDTFVAHTDSVLNALRSAFEQCAGYTRIPKEPLPDIGEISHVGYTPSECGYEK